MQRALAGAFLVAAILSAPSGVGAADRDCADRSCPRVAGEQDAPGGGTMVSGEDSPEVLVARMGPDGRVRIECVTGHAADGGHERHQRPE